MAKARYEIHVPNHARQVTIAAHHYLTSGPIRGINHATIHYGHPHDSLVVTGDESPELDSHMKQTGTFIGDVANAPLIDVTKQGKNIAHWPMANPHYVPAGSGPPSAGGSPLGGSQPPPALQGSDVSTGAPLPGTMHGTPGPAPPVRV